MQRRGRSTTLSTSTSLVGNRLVLAGAVMYLLEWVAIIAANVDAPLGAEQSTPHVLTAYDGRVQALGWAAGWFGIVLLGRVLIVIGLRTALADSGRPHPLMDFAVAAMLASVVIEITAYAIVAGAAWSHAHGGSTDVLRGIDAVAFPARHDGSRACRRLPGLLGLRDVGVPVVSAATERRGTAGRDPARCSTVWWRPRRRARDWRGVSVSRWRSSGCGCSGSEFCCGGELPSSAPEPVSDQRASR